MRIAAEDGGMRDDDDVIGTKAVARMDDLPLFAKPKIITPKSQPAKRVSLLWEQEADRAARAVYDRLDRIPWQSPAIRAALAAATDDAEKLLQLAERVANCLLDAADTMCVWEVRVQLLRLNLIDGTEEMDCLGALGTRMGLMSVGVERAPRIPELADSGGNRNTIWARREDARRSA
jgi:hypothetical protein